MPLSDGYGILLRACDLNNIAPGAILAMGLIATITATTNVMALGVHATGEICQHTDTNKAGNSNQDSHSEDGTDSQQTCMS